jgi:replication-associated recombination protein RarA
MIGNDYLWWEKYRPKKIADVILPKRLKDEFQAYVDKGSIPNLMLAGPPGTGKTTVALAMINELGADYMKKNGSLEVNNDLLRTTIADFASTMSLNGRKYVIIDEADYLSSARVQPAFRDFIQEYSTSTSFIFIVNYKNRIIEPLHSRFAMKEFLFTKDETMALILEQYKAFVSILEKENVSFDKNVCAKFVSKNFPDFRKVLVEAQSYCVKYKNIDTGLLTYSIDSSIISLIELLQKKDFSGVRKFITEGLTVDHAGVFDKLYEVLPSKLSPSAMAQATLIIGEYQYKAAFVANQDINLTACMVEIMSTAEWK